MNKYLLITSLFLFQSCASYINYTPEEVCAQRNMKLEGVTLGYGDGVLISKNTVSTFNTQNESYSCTIANSENEINNIKLIQRQLQPKNEYNDSVKMKQTINGIGYLFYIIPGIIFKVLFDSQKDDVLKYSEEIKNIK